ncbi:beta-ketoacyl synthase N-terminal-like domain-containing protein [Micromonospora sp. DT201]|uniref:beta-ketoacyl synthase N-terminal-like domain-containing protein n=1 Tax=Micromonospora sp. DT201 TaxID=3393442 RepID=UPI003CE99D51
MTPTPRPVPVISAWSAVSPFGYGRDDFSLGLSSGRSGLTDAAETDERMPAGRAGLVPSFEVRKVLGAKGTRGMDRLTGLTAVAVGHLAGDLPERELVGLVVGTTTGSQQSMADITRDTLIHAKPFYIETGHIPNAIMNSPAGQCAIRYDLRGPNATVAAGRVSSLSALAYARRLLATGRARTVLSGAAEEYSVARAWWDRHAADPRSGAAGGEGCVMFRVDARTAPADGIAELLAVHSRVAGAPGAEAALEACVRQALRQADVDAAAVWAVAMSAAPDARDRTEERVLDRVFGDGPRRIDCLAAIGDTASVAAGFQLGAVLAEAERSPDALGRVAVVTATDADGALGCAVLRLTTASRRPREE